jgi:hypothetical protein
MILEGFPGGRKYPQAQSTIIARMPKQVDGVGFEWGADPDAVRTALGMFGPKSGVNWAIFADGQSVQSMYKVAYWMTKRRFPTAVLINALDHWVVIDRIETNVNPVGNASINLLFVDIVDPADKDRTFCSDARKGGIRVVVDGTTWYAQYWSKRNNYAMQSSKWFKKYVAVVESTLPDGEAHAAAYDPGDGLIGAEKAVTAAQGYVNTMEQLRRPPYIALQKADPAVVFLAETDEKKRYYLVGFSQDRKSMIGAVIVTAGTGRFEEAAIFPGDGVKYLAEKTAVDIALQSEKLGGIGDRRLAGKLLFIPSDQSRTRFLPLWEVSADGDRRVYVSQSGEVFEALTVGTGH